MPLLQLLLFSTALLGPSLPYVRCDQQQEEVWKREIKVRYFSAAVLTCHHGNDTDDNNNNDINNAHTYPQETPHQVFWITPDASLLTNTTPVSEFPENVHPILRQERGKGLLLMALNITEVNDDAFGYYTCVMVMPDDRVWLTRWGLNVDGADFSELEKEYRQNAIIGAIAAAAMVLFLGGACLIWHFRYSRRHPPVDHKGKGRFEENRDVEMTKRTSEEVHRSNPGFEDESGQPSKETPEAEMAEVSGSGSNEGANSDDTKEDGLVGNGGDPVVYRM